MSDSLMTRRHIWEIKLECEFGGDRCFGVLADMDFILISTYEAEGDKSGTGSDIKRGSIMS